MPSLPIVVVTGGAGFIGSHTVDRLMAAGHRVVVLDNFSTGKRANLAQHGRQRRARTSSTCDVAHGIFAALAPITAKHGPVERIVHLAAQVSVVASVANPLVDMQVNYGGTLHVLEYARAIGVKKVVFASSAAVYGDVTRDAGRRGHAVPAGVAVRHRQARVASSRSTTTRTCTACATTALRFFNVYGPRQDPSSPYSGVISIFTDRARAGQPLTIFGDGSQTRDFVYVGDVVRAIVAALGDGNSARWSRTSAPAARSRCSSSRARSSICGNRRRDQHAPARAGEILKSRAHVDRLRDKLGVVAQTTLVDGLRATLG